MNHQSNYIRTVATTILVALSSFQGLLAQDEIVLPAPETAALFRYQEYPMDHSTGLPQISIPLFTIQNGSLSVPISISYHASGFKVTDVDGPIAAGWSLNIGGMVSRTIHGDPDFGEFPFPDPFDPYLNTPGQDILQILEQVTHHPDNPDLVGTGDFKDSQYDIFSYNFDNHSGKFIFKDVGGAKTPIFLDQKPLIISPSADANGLNGLEITDDSGNHFTFVGQENVTTHIYNYTGFALKQIVSANLKDTISYTYGGVGQQYRRYISQTETLKDEWNSNYENKEAIPELLEGQTSQYYDIFRVTEIDFEQGTLQFVLKGGNGEDKNLIDNIQLKDRNGNLIRKVKFKRIPLHSISAVGGTTNLQTHKLTGIEIQDKNENTVEQYAFDHYSSIYAGHNAANKIIDTRFIDYWGYYNASGDTYMIPKGTVSYRFTNINPQSYIDIGNPNTNNRAPHLEALKSGVLKKIYYPTGGSTEFIYEHNKYKDSETSSIENGPGLRVQRVIYSDGNGNTFDRNFEYSTSAESITGYGTIDVEPKVEYMHIPQLHRQRPDSDSDHQERIFYSGFIPSVSELASRPIRYNFVTEYKGDASENIGKIIYEYDNFSWFSANVPLLNGEGGAHGKWHISQYRYWDTPLLKNQTDYLATKDANGLVIGYDEVRKITNSYTPIESQVITGLHVQRNYIFPPNHNPYGPNSVYLDEFFFRDPYGPCATSAKMALNSYFFK